MKNMKSLFGKFNLSQREMDTARLILDGLSNAEIAARLGIQTNTIKARSSLLYKKTGVASRSEFISKFKKELTVLELYEPVNRLGSGAEPRPQHANSTEQKLISECRARMFICSSPLRDSAQLRDSFMAVVKRFEHEISSEVSQKILKELLIELKLV